MTKLWFKTKNDQVIDLNNMDSFWIEEIPPKNEYHVFAKEDKEEDPIDWRLAEFDNQEEAQVYLRKIYLILNETPANNEKLLCNQDL